MGTRKGGYVTLNLALDLKRVSAQFYETRNNVNNKLGPFTMNSKVRSSWPTTMSNIHLSYSIKRTLFGGAVSI